MGILQAAIVAFVALILAPGFSFYFDITPKTVVILTGTAAAVLLEILRPRSKSQSCNGNGKLLRYFGVLIVCSAGSLGLSAVFSERPGLSLFGTNWRQFGVVTQIAIILFAWLVARNTAGQPAHARSVLRGIAI